jgi:hypothetical protein
MFSLNFEFFPLSSLRRVNDRAPFEIPRFLPCPRFFPPSCHQINLTGQRSLVFSDIGGRKATTGLTTAELDVLCESALILAAWVACEFLIINECRMSRESLFLILTSGLSTNLEAIFLWAKS